MTLLNPVTNTPTESNRADQEIDISRLIERDECEWNRFVKQYSPLVHSVVNKTIASHSNGQRYELVEEAVQESYLRLIKDNYRLLRQYDPSRARLSTWLAVIARSTTLNILKRSDSWTILLNENREVSDYTHSDGTESLEIPEGVLTSSERDLVHLSASEGLSEAEISRKLNLSRQTVYNRKSSAINKLRRFLSSASADRVKKIQKKFPIRR